MEGAFACLLALALVARMSGGMNGGKSLSEEWESRGGIEIPNTGCLSGMISSEESIRRSCSKYYILTVLATAMLKMSIHIIYTH